MSSNWSCILYKEQIVIHSEESDIAHQYFYPISVLQRHLRPSFTASSFTPSISERLGPTTTMSAPFIFPPVTRSSTPASVILVPDDEPQGNAGPPQVNGNGHGHGGHIHAGAHVHAHAHNHNHNTNGDGEDDDSGTVADGNPFPYPPWYPESAHFVRQWWPTLASVPRLSCTVVLLADHEPETHRTRYVLAQHYFKVPLIEPDELDQIPAAAAKAVADAHGNTPLPTVEVHADGFPSPQRMRTKHSPTVSLSSASSSTTSEYWNGDTPPDPDPDPDEQPQRLRGAESSMMRLWYVSDPFEVVCVLDGVEDDLDPDGSSERPRPLMAVDFGHAVWIEFVFPPDEERDEKRLRFVTFPPVTHDRDEMTYGSENGSAAHSLEGVVHTLEIPPELDLDTVETINIDQSQGAIIISVRDGKIFILCYE